MHSDSPTASRLSTVNFWILLAAIVLPAVLFIPSLSVPFQFTKAAFAAALALVGVAVYVFARLGERELSLPVAPLFFGVALLPLVFLITTVLAGNSSVTLLGEGLNPDSFAFIGIGFVLFALAALTIRKRDQILNVYAAFIVAWVLLALFQIIRFAFGSDTFTFGGVFAASSSSLLGTLHDSAIFFGLVAVLALVTLVALPISGMVRWVLTGILAVSLILLSIINLTTVWWIVGLFALGCFVYSFILSTRQNRVLATDTAAAPSRGKWGISSLSLVVLVVASVFLFAGNGVRDFIWSKFDFNLIDIRPSLQSTVGIGKSIYGENFLLGTGPGTFEKAWAKYRPAELNQTIAWNTDFPAGVGYVPTTAATGGILTLIAWLALGAAFLYTGFRTLMVKSEDFFSDYLSVSSFLGAGYLWTMAVVANPSPILILFAFILTGVFLASLRFRGLLRERTLRFDERPRLGFVAALGLTVLFLGSLASLFGVLQNYGATWYLQRAVVASAAGDLDTAEAHIQNSLRLNETDETYRLLTQIGVARLNALLAIPEPTETDRAQFESLLSGTTASAQRATTLDPAYYANWVQLGGIYQSMIPLNIEGAYDSAAEAFSKASELRPQSPAILLSQAHLERAAGNAETATTLAQQALAQRPNYTEAIFLLAQLDIEAGRIPDAIAKVESAAMLEPNNPFVFFQLGVLNYGNKSYENAAASFERAVNLAPDYANALYYLGLAYYELDRVDDASTAFERVLALNPENAEVQTILGNLSAGRAPLAGLAIADAVVDRQGPPVSEETEPANESSDAIIESGAEEE